MSLPDLDILEVKSVSDMISVFETPADDAAKLIGEDDVAIFSPQLDLMIVTSQYDLEEPVTTSQTVIFSVADAECMWPDPPEYVSDIVFECRWPSGANLVTEFQTFSDENATPSASLEYDDWLPYIGLAVDPAKHVHMSERVFPSGEKGAFTVLTQMDRIIAKDAKGPAEIELKLGTAHRALADAQKAAKEPFPKQAELDELEQRLAVLEQERIEAELQCQREQAQRDEAEAAAIEDGIEEDRAAEREHERAAAADDEAREAARVAELRRQGLICEDSAAHNAATAAPNGIASGCPDDVAEAARRSAAASAREDRDVGEKRKAGM